MTCVRDTPLLTNKLQKLVSNSNTDGTFTDYTHFRRCTRQEVITDEVPSVMVFLPTTKGCQDRAKL